MRFALVPRSALDEQLDDPSARRMPDMSTDAKRTTPTSAEPTPQHREKGIRIFMWPKVIFLYPTAIVALVCALGMALINDRTHDPTKPLDKAVAQKYMPADLAEKVSGMPAPMTDK